MSKSPVTIIESQTLISLRQQAQQAEIKERQALLKDFLGTIKKMMKDQAALHLPKTLDDTQRSVITTAGFSQLRLGSRRNTETDSPAYFSQTVGR